jgi:phosphate transport system permease protein
VTRRLWRSGEPFIWLTAGALAMALIMVGGLLAIIVVNAAGFFWPSEVVRLTLKDGTVLTGPVTERERIPGAVEGWRLKLNVANRDLYGADFVWADESAIVKRERPRDVAVVERSEWGLLIGTIVALREGGAIVASGPAAWPEAKRRLPAAAALRADIRAVEKRDIGAINHEQEKIRLRLRGLASRTSSWLARGWRGCSRTMRHWRRVCQRSGLGRRRRCWSPPTAARRRSCHWRTCSTCRFRMR